MNYLNQNKKHPLTLELNGKIYRGDAEPRTLLSDFIRDELALTGTHVGCEHGVCGACTVSVDGASVRSCLMFAVQAEGKKIRTVEGLNNEDGSLNNLQEAFRKHHALQCGFCTPGILISLTQLISDEPDADEARVRDVLTGHLCRCTGYQGIVDAALEVLTEQKIMVQEETPKHLKVQQSEKQQLQEKEQLE